MHEVDVGGPNPGSFTVGTPDVFGEAPLIPPVKMVESGVIRSDIEALVIRNSRTSRMNGLNMRARIAAINRTRQRIREVIAEYGLPTLMEAQQRILDIAGASFARRLRALPDGTWLSEGFLDHDGNKNRLYRICLHMTKQGERLVFDFTGTDEQARGAINCTRVGLESGVFSAILPMLCYDMPWSPGGIMPFVDIRSQEGTINNALHPAGVGMATVSAIFATSHVTSGAIAKMLACSDLQDEIQANWAPAWQGMTMAGHTAEGRPFTAVLLDETGGSGGRDWKDGVDCAGLPGSPSMAIANVETYEKEYPILYVYRRQSPDTGGPGLHRGGVGTEGLVIPHRNQGQIDLTVLTHGVSQPEAQGLYGGYPSSVQLKLLLRGADVRAQFAARRVPTSVEAIGAVRVEVLEAKQRTLLGPDDGFIVVCAGGGGYGDPLLRDPAAVIADVRSGLVSEEVARTIYGVACIGDGPRACLDAGATEELRRSLRRHRMLEGRPVGNIQTPITAAGRPLGRIGVALDILGGDGTACFACRHCGAALAPARADPKTGALVREVAIAGLSPWNRYAPPTEIVAREFCCPSCGHLIAVEVRKRSDPILFDTELALPGH